MHNRARTIPFNSPTIQTDHNLIEMGALSTMDQDTPQDESEPPYYYQYHSKSDRVEQL